MPNHILQKKCKEMVGFAQIVSLLLEQKTICAHVSRRKQGSGIKFMKSKIGNISKN